MLRRGTLLVAASLLAIACGRPEKIVIDKYFSAVNQRDTATVTSFATVDLEQKVDDWRLVQVVEEAEVPAPLVELLQKQRDAEAAVTAHKREIMNYNLGHTTEVDKVSDLRKNKKPIPPSLEGVAKIYDAFVEKRKELARLANEAKARVETERQIVTMSAGKLDDDVTGTMRTSVLELELTINGQPQPYLMTLRQYKLQTATGYKPMSRWIVTGLAPKS
jgi:hypothetical protein